MTSTSTRAPGALVITAIALATAATSCEVVDPGTVQQANASAASADPSGLSAALEAADAGAATSNRFEGREIVAYTVADGDTLWEIARDHKVSIADIRVASGLDELETTIRPGQELKIPLPEGVSATTGDPSAPGAAGGESGGGERPPAPTGLPEFDPDAPEQTGSPEPLSPAESGLAAPPPPPPGSSERSE